MFNLFGRRTENVGSNQERANETPNAVSEEREVMRPAVNEDDFIDNTDPNNVDRTPIVTINFGTQMPIDSIFAYIEKDWEEIGRQDAIKNPDADYLNSKVTIIRETLKHRFDMVRLRYNKDIRNYEAQMDNLKTLGVTTGMVQLEAHIVTCKEHLSKIDELEMKLKNNDPSMCTMVDSYRRGFIMGVAVTVNDLVK